MRAFGQRDLPRHGRGLVGKTDPTLIPLSREVTGGFQAGACGRSKPYQMEKKRGKDTAGQGNKQQVQGCKAIHKSLRLQVELHHEINVKSHNKRLSLDPRIYDTA